MIGNITVSLQNIWVASLFVAVLCGSHFLTPTVRGHRTISSPRITSFAGGVAVAYVFLHMLPELIESRDNIFQLIGSAFQASVFTDLLVFFIALLGFETYYILEYNSMKKKDSELSNQARMFRFTMSFYFIYSFILTYTMIVRVKTGIIYAVLFTIAMSLHFLLMDRHIRRYYPVLFSNKTRIILLFALILGFSVSILLPINIYIAAFLTAFLSGSVLYTSFSEEITLTRKTSIFSFIMGTLIMAVILSAAIFHSVGAGHLAHL